MILFKEVRHKTREINLPKFGSVIVATTTLRDLLLDDDCEYTSDEARAIDEQIFFFVENHEFDINNKSLTKLILSQLK